MTTATSSTPSTSVYIRLKVPEEVFRRYEAQAEEAVVLTEDLMAARLTRVVDQVDDSKPLYFNDSQRSEFETLVGRNVSTTVNALRSLRTAMTVRVDNVHVKLKPELLKRLKDRRMSMEWPDFCRLIIRQELERFCNLR